MESVCHVIADENISSIHLSSFDSSPLMHAPHSTALGGGGGVPALPEDVVQTLCCIESHDSGGTGHVTQPCAVMQKTKRDASVP